MARARTAGGPFKDFMGKPLIGTFHNGARPIDPFVFRDTDDTSYMAHGGWGHCSTARLNDDSTEFVPFDGGATFRGIIPEGHVERSFMLLTDGRYYHVVGGRRDGAELRGGLRRADPARGPVQARGQDPRAEPRRGDRGRPSWVRSATKSFDQRLCLYKGLSRMQGPSFSQIRPRFGCFLGAFSPSCLQIRSTRL